MSSYRVRYQTVIEISVTVVADDEDDAREKAHGVAQQYADTVWGDGRYVEASVSLDGVGAWAVEQTGEREVVDLVAALRASVEAAKARRAGGTS